MDSSGSSTWPDHKAVQTFSSWPCACHNRQESHKMCLNSIIPNKCSVLHLGPSIIPGSSANSRLNSSIQGSWYIIDMLSTDWKHQILTYDCLRYCQNLCADQSKISEPDQERTKKAPKLRGAKVCKDTQCHSIKILLGETWDTLNN